jgi:signal transduction histidine kinase
MDRAREEFLSLVSHELRLPVAAIGLIAETLAETPGLGPTEQRAINRLHQLARDLSRLAEDLLTITSLESGQFRLLPGPVDLHGLVVDLTDHAADPTRIRVEGHPGPVPIHADADRVRQAIGNLLSNALKYSPPQAPIRVIVTGDAATAEVSVVDQGVGFPADQARLLFRKYGRLRSQGTAHIGGVGLGLYLTRLLVEAHGGVIQAASAGPGKGATFTITLPRRHPPSRGSAAEHSSQPDTQADTGEEL